MNGNYITDGYSSGLVLGSAAVYVFKAAYATLL
jgi:hypothetical protein